MMRTAAADGTLQRRIGNEKAGERTSCPAVHRGCPDAGIHHVCNTFPGSGVNRIDSCLFLTLPAVLLKKP